MTIKDTARNVNIDFNPQPAQPPRRVFVNGRRSPYLPSDEQLAQLLKVLRTARDTDTPYISPIGPVATMVRARLASTRYREALAPLLKVGDPKAFAVRVWEPEQGSGQWMFAIALKRGAE